LEPQNVTSCPIEEKFDGYVRRFFKSSQEEEEEEMRL
jgi:hypothetical protein